MKESPALIKVLALLSICERRQGEPSGMTDMETAFGKLDDAKLRSQLSLELANASYQQGDFEKTSSVLHALLLKDPDNVNLLFFAQRVYSELADTTLNKLAVLAPSSARMEQLIAERLINAGDLKDATAHYRTALNANPKLPGLHLELAESLMEDAPNNAGTQAEARRELEVAIQVDGDSSKVECVLGRIALLQTDRTDAYSHYHRAYELNPNDVNAQMGLAEVLRVEDKPGEAATYLRREIKVDPLRIPRLTSTYGPASLRESAARVVMVRGPNILGRRGKSPRKVQARGFRASSIPRSSIATARWTNALFVTTEPCARNSLRRSPIGQGSRWIGISLRARSMQVITRMYMAIRWGC